MKTPWERICRSRPTDPSEAYLWFQRRIVLVLMVLFVALVGLGIVNARLIDANSERSQENAALAQEAKDLGRRATRLGEQINRERARNIRTACDSTNSRRARAIGVLDRGVGSLPPEQQVRVRASRDFTAALIAALVPERDCESEVNRQVRGAR